MASYRIVAARPKNASNHVNSQFSTYVLDLKAGKWVHSGWKSIIQIAGLMQEGHELLTGKIIDGEMHTGAAVELELRITKNDTDYKISQMPNQ